MNTPPAMTTTEPTTPVKEQPPKTYNGTPRKLDFSDCGPIPGKVIQPFDPVEWVYPNDGESEFYSYEQMMNDWVPSDIEEDESSSDDEVEEIEYEDEW